MTPPRKAQLSVAALVALLAGGAVFYWMHNRQSSKASDASDASIAANDENAASELDPELQRKLERLRSLAAGVSGERQSVSPEADSSAADDGLSSAQHFKRIPSVNGTSSMNGAPKFQDSRQERLLQSLERMRQNGTSDAVREILERRKSERLTPSPGASAGVDTAQ